MRLSHEEIKFRSARSESKIEDKTLNVKEKVNEKLSQRS